MDINYILFLLSLGSLGISIPAIIFTIRECLKRKEIKEQEQAVQEILRATEYFQLIINLSTGDAPKMGGLLLSSGRMSFDQAREYYSAMSGAEKAIATLKETYLGSVGEAAKGTGLTIEANTKNNNQKQGNNNNGNSNQQNNGQKQNNGNSNQAQPA